MSRQYFDDMPVEPLAIANVAVAFTTTELCMFGINASQWTIPALDVRPGKIWRLTAGGVYTTPATGTLTITPGWGSTLANRIILGASGAQTIAASPAGAAWWLNALLKCVAVGLAGANSTFVAQGMFNGNGVLANAASGNQIAFGGTQSTVCDPNVGPGAGGFYIGMTWSVTAASVTTNTLALQSLN